MSRNSTPAPGPDARVPRQLVRQPDRAGEVGDLTRFDGAGAAGHADRDIRRFRGAEGPAGGVAEGDAGDREDRGEEGVAGRPVHFPVLWFFKGLQGGKFSSRSPRGRAAAVDAVADRVSSEWSTLGKQGALRPPRSASAATIFPARPCHSCARSAARPCTRSCGFDASETIPFPGADSIFSRGCGAISRRPSFAVSLSRRDPGDRSASAREIDDRLGVSSDARTGSRAPGSRGALPARRVFLPGAGRSAGPWNGLAQNRDFSAFCEFSMLCKAENFRLGRNADPIFRATGVRRGPKATTSRVDWRPTLIRVAARARRCRRAGLVAAI